MSFPFQIFILSKIPAQQTFSCTEYFVPVQRASLSDVYSY